MDSVECEGAETKHHLATHCVTEDTEVLSKGTSKLEHEEAAILYLETCETPCLLKPGNTVGATA